MTRWLLAAIIGSMIAALHYGQRLRETSSRARLVAPVALRAFAAAMFVALLVQAPLRGGAPLRPLVALDVSASWLRGGMAGSRWPAAAEMATRAAAGDSVLLVGDSLRLSATIPSAPTDRSSSSAGAAERARREGRAILLITDGEGGELPVGALPPGSRVEVMRRPATRDLALARLELPDRAAPGDTVAIRLTVRSGDAGSGAATVGVQLGAARSTVLQVPASDSLGERSITLRVAIPSAGGPQIVRAIAHMAGDAEPANDTIASVIEVTRTPVAVLVSTAPDPDARDALDALRGALAAAPMGFYRVAPGRWRRAGSLAAVSETEVRRALAEAPLAVIHGDTALLGAPSSATRGSLILMLPAVSGERSEWRATPVPDSPLASALVGIAWDSVPPIDPAATAATGDWNALAVVSRADGERRVIVAGAEQASRRRAVVAAGGMWRWRARGGVASDAYGALWGAVIDWVGRSRPDARAAVPEATAVREGDPISWRRGGSDTLVTVLLARRDREAPIDSVRLAFSAGATTTHSAPIAAGEYLVTVAGGSAILVVNRTREMLPARQTIQPFRAPGNGPRAPAVPLRERWWPFALALAALCGEWILRRRAGLR